LPPKTNPKSSYKTPIILFAVAAILLGASTINMCEGCSGWNVINPWCQAGMLACVGQWGTIHLIMQAVALVLILVGAWRLIKMK